MYASTGTNDSVALKNENPAPGKARDVQVELRVQNISREGLRHLESLLSQWALWHRTTYAEGYSSEVQLLSGLLALDVARLFTEGVVDWRDTVGAVPGTGQAAVSTAAGYEQMEAPPAYDRAIDELLAPPVDLTAAAASMLPGGAAAARRRHLAESCLQAEAGAADDTPAKRRRLPGGRCFNCGSYAHGIQQCFKPVDQARVAAARQEARAAGGPALMGRRYFEEGKGASKPNSFEGLGPGKISDELAQALGLHDALAPPPWLRRMAALGVPPRYADSAAGGSAIGTATGGDIFMFISDDEEDAAAEAASGAADADESEVQQQEQEGSTILPDAVGSNGAVSLGANGQHEPAAARVPLPGINSSIPGDADQLAWQVELDKGLYLARMLA